VKEFWQSDSTC